MFKIKESLFNALIENTPDAIAIADINGILLEYSDSFLKLFGFNSEEGDALRGKNGFRLLSPGNDERARDSYKNLLKYGFLSDKEGTFIKKDGSEFIGLLNLSIINDQDKRPSYIFAIVRDITEYKNAQEKIQESEENYRRLYETAQVGFWTSFTKDARITKANDKAASIFGLARASDIIGTKVAEFCPVEVIRNLYELIQEFGLVTNFVVDITTVSGNIDYKISY